MIDIPEEHEQPNDCPNVDRVLKELRSWAADAARQHGFSVESIDDLTCQRHPGSTFIERLTIIDSELNHGRPLKIYECSDCSGQEFPSLSYDCPNCGIMKLPPEEAEGSYYCGNCNIELGEKLS